MSDTEYAPCVHLDHALAVATQPRVTTRQVAAAWALALAAGADTAPLERVLKRGRWARRLSRVRRLAERLAKEVRGG